MLRQLFLKNLEILVEWSDVLPPLVDSSADLL